MPYLAYVIKGKHNMRTTQVVCLLPSRMLVANDFEIVLT